MIVVDRYGLTTEPKPRQMKGKRRRHEPEFKARVAIEALKGAKTIQQIAKEFEIHPVQVSDWKKQMLEGACDLFSAGKKKSTEEHSDSSKEVARWSAMPTLNLAEEKITASWPRTAR